MSRYSGAFSATLAGIRDLFRRSEPIGRLDDDLRLEGRHALVTGAGSGLGRAVARELARRGARVSLAVRRPVEDLGPGETTVHLDLLRFDSIDALVHGLAAAKDPFDIVVFNAGVVASRSRRSPEGYDEMLQVNYLSKYLLSRRLLEAGLVRSADPGFGPRLVFVASETHRSSPDLTFPSFMEIGDYAMKDAIRSYGYSKLLLATYSEELDRRLAAAGSRIAVHTLCPGPMNTGIAREAPGWAQPLLKAAFSLFFRSPEAAAEPVLYLSTAPELEGRSSLYLHLMNRKEKDERALDPETGRRLWKESAALFASRLSGDLQLPRDS